MRVRLVWLLCCIGCARRDFFFPRRCRPQNQYEASCKEYTNATEAPPAALAAAPLQAAVLTLLNERMRPRLEAVTEGEGSAAGQVVVQGQTLELWLRAVLE